MTTEIRGTIGAPRTFSFGGGVTIETTQPSAVKPEPTGIDRLTTLKTDYLISQGHSIVGYVLQNEGDRIAISSQAAVRWLTESEYWNLMHPAPDDDGTLNIEQIVKNAIFGNGHPTGNWYLAFANKEEVDTVANQIKLALAECKPAQVSQDHDEAVILLSAVFDAWENGDPCTEGGQGDGSFMGNAFRLDDDIFQRCCNLLNRLNPPRNASPPDYEALKAENEKLKKYSMESLDQSHEHYEQLAVSYATSLTENKALKDQLLRSENDNTRLQSQYDEMRLKCSRLPVVAENEALKAELQHWKSNHADVVKRLAIATQRLDLPVDRIPAIKENEALKLRVAELEASIEQLRVTGGRAEFYAAYENLLALACTRIKE